MFEEEPKALQTFRINALKTLQDLWILSAVKALQNLRSCEDEHTKTATEPRIFEDECTKNSAQPECLRMSVKESRSHGF